jgi:hypothetical protein
LVQSFGRSRETPPEQVPPVMVMPPVQIPAVLTIDEGSMAAVQDQIRRMVAAAVRQGFAEAVGEYDPEAAQAFTMGAAEPAAEQLADLAGR